MTTTAPAASSTSSRRRLALALIAAAQFMVIMDTSIIGVALPKMQADLGFDPQDLSWVFNSYVIVFGGLLLLGGRLSDLFGARRIFTTGWAGAFLHRRRVFRRERDAPTGPGHRIGWRARPRTSPRWCTCAADRAGRLEREQRPAPA